MSHRPKSRSRSEGSAQLTSLSLPRSLHGCLCPFPALLRSHGWSAGPLWLPGAPLLRPLPVSAGSAPRLPRSGSAGLSHQPLISFLESPAPLSYPRAGPRLLEGKVHDSLILPGGARGTACRCSRYTAGPELSLPECWLRVQGMAGSRPCPWVPSHTCLRGACVPT